MRKAVHDPTPTLVRGRSVRNTSKEMRCACKSTRDTRDREKTNVGNMSEPRDSSRQDRSDLGMGIRVSEVMRRLNTTWRKSLRKKHTQCVAQIVSRAPLLHHKSQEEAKLPQVEIRYS